MANPEQLFNDLNVDVITGVELMEALNIGVDEIGFPQRFHRLQEVVGYLKQFPIDTQRYLIRKACYGKQVDKLDHMFEYTNLLKNKYEIEQNLGKIKAEKSAVGNDMGKAIAIAQVEKETEEHLARVNDEVQIYER
jgi:hypothetical protein